MRISDWSSDVCSSDLHAESDTDHRDDQHKRLIARIAEDHRHQTKGVHGFGEAVIGMEAGVDRPGRCCDKGRSDYEQRTEQMPHDDAPAQRLRLAAAPAVSRASRSPWRTTPA